MDQPKCNLPICDEFAGFGRGGWGYNVYPYCRRHMQVERHCKKLRSSLAELYELYVSAGCACAICAKPLSFPDLAPGRRHNPPLGHIDHDHETGLLRGLLCHRCNVDIARIGDTSAKVRVVLGYMEAADHRANALVSRTTRA